MATKIATKETLDNGVRFTFADKASTKLDFNLSELKKDMLTALALHGLKQKLGDSYAGVDSISEAIEGVKAIWKNLQAGNFNTRTGGNSILSEAIARIKGISLEQASELLASLDEEALEKVKKNAQVKATMLVIRGERAATIANSESDLDI